MVARTFVYLAAVVDWFNRRVFSHRLSITMEAAFCIEALEEALAHHGTPDIFNTDQGSQFTSATFKRRHHFASFNRCKSRQIRATLCRHRGAP
jgi:transposase InsO family protein